MQSLQADETHALGASPSEESEIAEVNQHTNGIEYHGNTSSMSFLGSLQKLREQRAAPSNPAERKAFSLVSVLHNPSFVSRRNFTSDLTAALAANGFYSKRANTFIEGYFGGIHYVHPIIDKEDFLSRADQLWRGTDCSDAHFVALYLSVLSLGALTRTWNESTLDGLNRFQWSRKLFAEAQTILDEIQFSSKVETIQAFYVMVSKSMPERTQPKSEMSFLLGRPDTLGQDEYHNRVITPVDDSEYAIISSMVQFGRIMRKVSIGIYHSQLPTPETIGLACEIEREMDSWVDALPQRRGASLREPDWRRKQRLVLELRYHNVRMLLFRPFVTYYARERLQPSDELMAAVEKCISSAQKTIEIVYEAYKVHTYFRTWWYNTTYITIAASVLLLYESQTKQHSTTSTLALIETAIEILEVMDESIVARNAAEVIRRFVRELNTVPNGNSDDSMLDTTAMENVQQAPTPGPWNALDFGLTGFEFLNFPLGEMEAVFDELYKNLDHNAQLE
ncbi:zn(ii)2cys6 transcription factor [Fusarium flagelliforme]|uniref:Zn(Ii)2cys6 transcription factor n=1 Tax=Fusarium flagelliforme TaxID=2675880 RepID=A0A395MAV9_9HYPO|nr:zn(ii)2cys6 transcription factor [Fusarium flagelliforme]